MGRDKALLPFCGRAMIEIALAKLRTFCSAVSIAGNREDLALLASVIREERALTGPAAGIEAALWASAELWVLLIPVDVPLVPAALLRAWGEAVLKRESEGVRVSFLRSGAIRQPAFCMLHKECAASFTQLVESGERKLGLIFELVTGGPGADALWIVDAEGLAVEADLAVDVVPFVFGNVNTPDDLARLEEWTGCHSQAHVTE